MLHCSCNIHHDRTDRSGQESSKCTQIYEYIPFYLFRYLIFCHCRWRPMGLRAWVPNIFISASPWSTRRGLYLNHFFFFLYNTAHNQKSQLMVYDLYHIQSRSSLALLGGRPTAGVEEKVGSTETSTSLTPFERKTFYFAYCMARSC